MTRLPRVCAVVLLVGVGLSFTVPAWAKGGGPARGYAVVTGPGLAHPIIVSAPWNPRLGGYYGGEAEALLNVATFSGAIPGLVHYTSRHPSAAVLGPRYEVTYFMDGSSAVVHQFLYPFSSSGELWARVPAGQRSASHTVFGRYWGGGPAGDWARGHPGNTSLLDFLQTLGMPSAGPSVKRIKPQPSREGGPVWVTVAVALGALALTSLPPLLCN